MEITRKMVKIVLKRQTTDGYGFNIKGGIDNPYNGSNGIFISKIREGSPAAIDGRLSVGDEIITINGERFEDIKHGDAVRKFVESIERLEIEVLKSTPKSHKGEDDGPSMSYFAYTIVFVVTVALVGFLVRRLRR